MTVNLETRSVESAAATEIYISAVPDKDTSPQRQASEIFAGLSDLLRSKNARILQERVFAAQPAMDVISEIRTKAYSDFDDGVAASMLICKEGFSGPVAGVQIHAVVCDSSPEVIELDGVRCGRILRLADRAYLTLSQISAPQLPRATEQARSMLEKAESILKQYGGGFFSVPRTWMWLGDMLSWYDDFNQVRNGFFVERGILGKSAEQPMPASTGIGLSPADGGECAMDLAAVLEPKDSIEYLNTTGKQQSAFDYGSAFARAARAVTPAGQTVFVSGTASIDADGATTNIDDGPAQINDTIENVQAVLRDMHCVDSDVVQVMAYCKTPQIEELFNNLKDKPDWPWVPMICDVCRDDLLFEIEAAAMPRT